MTIVIVTILFVGFCLISTERLTNINKTAVAIFIGTLGWMLYIGNGREYIMEQHPEEYMIFLGGESSSGSMIKQFIAQNIFLKYVGKASEIVLFILATMTIVEILQNNGCFDFISQYLRTHNSNKMLWVLSVFTFVLSANLDNLTSTVMVLTMMHAVVRNRRQRMLLGCAVVISANCGGMLTVIGDPTGLVLWNNGLVTATNYSLSLALPCLAAWYLPVWWIGRSLPERLDTEWITMPYRGDDANLKLWQKVLMFVVGIGGLWFIPTFHNITKLSPFIGALCVLAILWVVNEIVNRKSIDTSDIVQRRVPRALQYGVIQMILFVMGIMLVVGVVRETGAIADFTSFLDKNINNIWVIGFFSGVVSSFLDNFATAMSMISLREVDIMTPFQFMIPNEVSPYIQNGLYWKVVAYASAAGGNILCSGSMSGLALMKMERLHIGWYVKNISWKVVAGFLLGFIIMMILCI